MKERIFFISPLPEEEDEEKAPYDEQGNTTAMAYYDEHGNTIEADDQEQEVPTQEQNTLTENRIIIIYEAPRPKVLAQQNNTQEISPAILTPEEIPTINPLPEEYTVRPERPDIVTRIYGAERPDIVTRIYGAERPDIVTMLYGNEENHLTLIRNELQEITTETRAPGAQPGEIQVAA